MPGARRLAAAIVACGALVVLPVWRPAFQVMEDDFLWFIGPMLGLAMLTFAAGVTVASLTLAAGLLRGDPRARLSAVVGAVVAFVGAVYLLVSGSFGTLTDSGAFTTGWVLAFVGGPAVVVLVLADGPLPRPRLFDIPDPKPGVTPWFVGLQAGQWLVAGTAFACLAAGLVLTGGRRLGGAHPALGLLLVLGAFGLGAAVDLQRRRRRADERRVGPGT